MNKTGLLVRMSYRGTEFAVLHTDESRDDVLILSGELVSAHERDGEIVEFQIPREETEVRLARVSPFGWMLVNETTGRAWTAGVPYPNNGATVELPLEL